MVTANKHACYQRFIDSSRQERGFLHAGYLTNTICNFQCWFHTARLIQSWPCGLDRQQIQKPILRF